MATPTKPTARLSQISATEVPVGKHYGPYVHELTEAITATWVRALGDRDPAYADDEAGRKAGYGGRVAPPGTMTLHFLKAAMDAWGGMPVGMILARQEVDFHAPARPGDRLATEFVIQSKTVKKDRPWIDLEMTTKNDKGETVAVSRITWIMAR
jgi:acyl dehydratase